MNNAPVWLPPEGDAEKWTKGPGQWFSEQPEHQGWYWHKPYLKVDDEQPESEHPRLYLLDQTSDGLVAWSFGTKDPVEDFGGWWFGPLAAPN